MASFEKWRTRLSDMSFLDPALQPAAKVIDSLLDSFPHTGPLRSQDYFRALATGLVLADPDQVRNMAKGLLTVDEVMKRETAWSQDPAASADAPSEVSSSPSVTSQLTLDYNAWF